MSVFILVQITVNIVLFLSSLVLWLRYAREPKDDPRLSRGLQLLQSKIAVLEDLSDRTDTQVKQLSQLLEQKGKDVQEKISQAERHIQLIKGSIDKSLEVAKIFQDKIPHQEIIERQNTTKYVRAAQLAHEGKTVEEISQLIDLNRGELELIVKLNRNNLMFAADQLPAWIDQSKQNPMQPPVNLSGADPMPELYMETRPAPARDMSQAFSQPPGSSDSLKKLGEDFRRACRDMEQKAPEPGMIQHADQWAEDLANNMVKHLAGNQVFQKAVEALSGVPNTAWAPGAELYSTAVPAAPPVAVPQNTVTPPTANQSAYLRPRELGIEPVVFKKIDVTDSLG